MDLKETVRQILEQFQVIAHQLPQLVVQIDGKQVGIFLDKGKEYKMDDEKRLMIIKKIQNKYKIPINTQQALRLIEDLEKDYYLNRLEKTIRKSAFSSPVHVFFVWKGHLTEEQQKRVYLATELWYRLELKIDFVNLDDGLYRQFFDE